MADVHLLAVLLSSTSAIHSCHLVAPSPHSEDPQVSAQGCPCKPPPKSLPQLIHVATFDPSTGSLWHVVTLID